MPELLVVDDDSALRSWTQRVLSAQGYCCDAVPDAETARECLRRGEYDLALLDVNLPGESGIDLLSFVRINHATVAVVMVTGEDNLTLAMSAIELGAYGYMVKPVRAGELVINVANALHRRRQEAATRARIDHLEASSDRATETLRRALEAAAESADIVQVFQSDTINRLVRLAEFRDEDTGHHLTRMSRYCELIALELGLAEAQCERIRLASQLHDVGKVAIADRILLKPGKLTADEYEVMKKHTEFGYELLVDTDTELMRLAGTIALTHHERWDGSGYPQGMGGDAIPLEGRIAAVGDVFDALTSDRVYRPAFPVGAAVAEMESERGGHFEPVLLDAMHAAFDSFDAIRRRYRD